MSKFIKFLGIAAFLLMGMPQSGFTAEQVQVWELVNPSGVVIRDLSDPAPRISTLEGKTVALYWNGKHNGDEVLNSLEALLLQKVPGIKTVKVHEKDPKTATISGRSSISDEKAAFIQSLKPDLVIGTQAD